MADGDFQSTGTPNASGEGFVRVRLPREGEILGVVIGNVGGGRLQVQCKDGKERLCRIPGKIRRNIWVRQGDVVLLKASRATRLERVTEVLRGGEGARKS